MLSTVRGALSRAVTGEVPPIVARWRGSDGWPGLLWSRPMANPQTRAAAEPKPRFFVDAAPAAGILHAICPPRSRRLALRRSCGAVRLHGCDHEIPFRDAPGAADRGGTLSGQSPADGGHHGVDAPCAGHGAHAAHRAGLGPRLVPGDSLAADRF